MIILAIDPGPERSAVVWWECEERRIVDYALAPNGELRDHILCTRITEGTGHLAVEMIASYGMPVGREVFETCVWIGRYIEAWGGPHTLIYRRQVKLHLCDSARAKDGNVRQALIDRVGPVGTKKAPGPCYGMRRDLWAALGVAVTWAETLR